MTQEAEESAALACLAALTEWFEPGGGDMAAHLGPEDPVHVVEFLFGVLTATISHVSEVLNIDPSDYVQDLALQIARDITGVLPST